MVLAKSLDSKNIGWKDRTLSHLNKTSRFLLLSLGGIFEFLQPTTLQRSPAAHDSGLWVCEQHKCIVTIPCPSQPGCPSTWGSKGSKGSCVSTWPNDGGTGKPGLGTWPWRPGMLQRQTCKHSPYALLSPRSISRAALPVQKGRTLQGTVNNEARCC